MGTNEIALKELERLCGEGQYIELTKKCVSIFNKLKIELTGDQLELLMLFDEAVGEREAYITDFFIDA